MDTNNFLINKVLHKNNANYIMVLLMIFIFYFMIEHIFYLTKTVYNYNNSIDYGKYIQNVCGKEHFEYETPRFQFADNIDNIVLDNDTNKNRYITFILVISIIISLFISAIFTYLVYNTFINTEFLYKFVELSHYECMAENRNSIKAIFAYILCLFIELFVNPFRILYYLIRHLFTVKEKLKYLLFLIYVILAYLVTIVVLLIMPLYIGLIMTTSQDISPFHPYISVYGWYIGLFVLLILMRFLYYLFYNEFESDVSSYVLTEYLSDNLKNLYTSNHITGTIGFFVFMAIYIVMFFILGNIIRFYNNNKLDIKEVVYNTNDTVATNINIRQNLVDSFMNNVLGYKEYNNFLVQNIFLNKSSGITFILLIIIFTIVACMFFCKFLGMIPNVYRLFAYGIIVPLIILFIVLFITKNTTVYNTYFNKYIVSEPVRLYKQYIQKIHVIFNKTIQNDYIDVELTGGYICRNIGNAILLSLYSTTFAGLDKVNKNSVPVANAYIDFTPEFIYDKQCNSAVSFHYADTKYNEYDIEYYLNGKQEKKSILYTYNDCSAVNVKALSTIGKNLVKMFGSDTLKKLMKQIFEAFYVSESGVVKSTEPMQYIKQEIINKSENAKTDLKNFIDKLKKQIHQSIYNMHNKKVYNNPNKKYIYYMEKTKKFEKDNQLVNLLEMEVHHYNNTLDTNLQIVSEEHHIKSYDLIVDKITDIYMELVYAHLYIFAPIYTYVLLSNTSDNYKAYLNDYVRLLSKHIIETFNNINKQLSYTVDKLKNDKLTKFIINNYNTIYMDKLYTKNILDGIIPRTKQGITNQEIENDVKIYYKYLKDMMDIFENIKNLDKMFKTNKQQDIAFISMLSDSQYNIKIYITNFNDYIERRKLQDTDINPELFKLNINMIFRANDDRYFFDYFQYTTTKKSTTKEIKLIEKDIYSMTIEMMKLCSLTLNEIESKQDMINLYMTKEMSLDIFNVQNKYSENIEYYTSILQKNINSLNNDYINYMQNKDDIDNQFKDIDMSIDLSKNISKEACDTDKLIYLVIINYIIALLSVNLIML